MRSRSLLACLAVSVVFLAATPTRAALLASQNFTWAPNGADVCKGMPISFTGPGILSIRLQMKPFEERQFPNYYTDVILGTDDLPYFAKALTTTINGGPRPASGLRGKPVDRVALWEVTQAKKWGVPLSVCPPVNCNPGGCIQYGATATVTVEFTGTATSGTGPVPSPGPAIDATVPIAGSATVENGTDRAGSDYQRVPNVGDPGACRARCDADTRCKAYTWVKPGLQGPTAVCYLKSSVPKATGNSCCVSGTKTIAASPPTSHPVGALVNHALASAGAKATQSSTYSGSCPVGAEFAIDGVTDAGIAYGCNTPIAHTQSEPRAWWRVELAAPRVIQKIVIWNRNDVAKERLTNFTVSILAANGAVVFAKDVFTSGGFPTPSLAIPVPAVIGKRVQVQLRGTNYLSLAEVQVLGPAN